MLVWPLTSLLLGLVLATGQGQAELASIRTVQQQLGYDKLVTYRYVAPSKEQQQQQQPLASPPNRPSVIAKDLQGPTHRQAGGSVMGARPVINGNQATYVEPPADFKPIIYDLDNNIIAGRPPTHQQAEAPGPLDSLEQAVAGQLEAAGQQPAQQADSGNLVGGGEEGSPSELKPSVGRWLDWHDMSVEPDLASSDTSSSAAFYAPRRLEVPLRSRYVAADKAPSTISWHHARPADELAASRQVEQPYQQVESQIKGAHLRRGSAGQAAANPAGSAAAKGTTLIQVSGNNLIKMQPLNHEHNERKLRSSPPASGQQGAPQHQVEQPIGAKQQQEQQAPSWSPASQIHQAKHLQQQQQPQVRRSKRRKKSKTNAEVRIQQLVAKSEQQQQHHLHRQLQPHQPQESVISEPGKQVNGLGAANQAPASQQQVEQVERVPANQRPGQLLLVRRLGSLAAPINATSGATSRPPKRRRIKTLLPVGLTSWFLGGIRDLDGRHWHLPAEVMSKLAINDVDLHHQQESQPVEPPQAPDFQQVPTSQRIPISQLIPR